MKDMDYGMSRLHLNSMSACVCVCLCGCMGESVCVSVCVCKPFAIDLKELEIGIGTIHESNLVNCSYQFKFFSFSIL